MMPKQSQIEVPLLQVLNEMGGNGIPKEIYPRVTTKLSDLTEDVLRETVGKGRNNKLTNRIQWTRQALIDAGDMVSLKRGVWAITEQGRNRLRDGDSQPTSESMVGSASIVSLVTIYEDYEEQFRS